MALAAGTRIGAYEVQSLLGIGGMGEVYRATDTSLKRQVAIKVLPASVAHDAERLARFQREAEVLASLNHPNIAQIYGLERPGGITALVMELVEGPTLAELIHRQNPNLQIPSPKGPEPGTQSQEPARGLPVAEALAVARQIADALESAHDQGIVHRDLKPANIKVRDDGTVKVLDFGLAKAIDPVGRVPQSGPVGVSQSPTITSPALMTSVGVILGTAAYMSPEQAKGRPADTRSDVWAFGCVLYEMLTGRRAFDGDDMADVLGAVTRLEPDWTALPASVPARVTQGLRVCLVKDPKQRVRDIHAVRLALDGAFETTDIVARAVHSTHRISRREGIAWGLATLGLLAVVFLVGQAPRSNGANTASVTTRLSILPPTGAALHVDSIALSPDGSAIVFTATLGQSSALWVRSLDSTQARRLDETDGAEYPFWSPDGRTIGFFADQKLKIIPTVGGAPRVLVDAPRATGGAWSNDTILFSVGNNGPIQAVSATGGLPTAVTALDDTLAETGHVFPAFLPNGRQFIYFARGAEPGINLGSLDATPTNRLTSANGKAVFATDGNGSSFLLFVRSNTLLAQAFDVGRLELRGDPVPVADGPVGSTNGVSGAPLTATSGAFAYVSFPSETELVWMDRRGVRIETLAAPAAEYTSIELSPDDRRVATLSQDSQGRPRGIWLLDSGGGGASRFTPPVPLTAEGYPRWSSGGRQIAFSRSVGEGLRMELVVKDVNDPGSETVLLTESDNMIPGDWSSDGRWLVLRRVPVGAAGGLWTLSMTPPPTMEQVPLTESRGLTGRFSPNGRWLAYSSEDTGRLEVYVQRFPGATTKLQATLNGGERPLWRRDGRELYYVALDTRGTPTLFAAPVTTESDLRVGPPTALMPLRYSPESTNTYPYAVTANGQRILQIVPTQSRETIAITLVTDWSAGLEQVSGSR